MTEVITASSLLRKYRRDLFDYSAQAREVIEAEVGKLSCHRGCGFCCYAKVVIDLAEGVLMYLFLKASGAWTKALEARLLAADAEMGPTSHDDWMPRRRPCVFLKEQEFGKGECQVYPVRPLACAATFSPFDPVNCATPGGKNIVSWVPPEGAKHFVTLHIGIQQGLGVNEPLGLTIPGAVLYAHALVEDLPLPQVHTVPIADMVAAGGEGPFDEEAARRKAGRFDQVNAGKTST